MRRRLAVPALVAGALALLAPACSGDEASAPTTQPFGPTECAEGDPLLAVDQIDAAVTALEAELGGPQLYFEINATSALVNLLVADAEDATVTPYAYVGGELSSEEPITGATGNTFVADSIDIDPARVLSCVASELPSSRVELFFIEGGPQGAVRYSVLTSNDQGGQLLVEVTGQGLVVGVETL